LVRPAGFGSQLLGDFRRETKTNTLLLHMAKQFTLAEGWSATFAYNGDTKTTRREWNTFDFTHSKSGQGGFKPSTLLDQHRLVAAAVADNLLPSSLTLAGKVNWASGFARRLVSCPGGFPDAAVGRAGSCITVEGELPSFRQVDPSVSKQVSAGAHKSSRRGDPRTFRLAVIYRF
jgi:hypothetical protein